MVDVLTVDEIERVRSTMADRDLWPDDVRPVLLSHEALRAEVERLRQLAGIDDDRALVMAMMAAMRKAMHGKVNEGTLHDAARAALAVVREVKP